MEKIHIMKNLVYEVFGAPDQGVATDGATGAAAPPIFWMDGGNSDVINTLGWPHQYFLVSTLPADIYAFSL